MAPAPTLTVTLRFAGGPGFGPTLVFGSTVATVGKGVFGTSANDPIDITSRVRSATIRRGRTRALDKFEAASATVQLLDETGEFDPQDGTHGEPAPMLQLRLSATYNGTERILFSGFTQDFDYAYQPGVDASLLTITAVDAFRAFNLSNITAVAGTSAGQSTGGRIDDILDAIDWPTTVRDVDTGDTTLLDDDGTSRDALTALQRVAQAEMGGFWIDGDGDVRFLSRSNSVKQARGTPTVFDDDGTDVTYQGVDFEMDEQLLINSARITRTGGTAQEASNQTSIDDYFKRSFVKGSMIMDTDVQALDHARMIVAARKDPELRIRAITLDLTDNVQTRVEAGLDLDFFDPITVNRTTPGGKRIAKTLTVQGVEHRIKPDRWITKLSTAEMIADGFIIGTDKLGTGILGF